VLTLLTATGCRPEAFAILERLMAAQTYAGPVRWVIVDDGEQQQSITFQRDGWTLEVVRPEPFWRPGQNTQARNLLAGLQSINRSAKLLIIEDDDHYASDWLEVCDQYLARASLVGETKAKYYNVKHRVGRQLNNTQHASLCATAMRDGAIEVFRKLCTPERKFIDIELWRGVRDRLLFNGSRVVGIKGMPGRGGIGMGHKADFNGTPDHNSSILRQWIGQHAEWYL
jgi:hypothetical protein